MNQNDAFIKNLCNELAQPVTTLLLAIELVERGVASPQDIEAMRTEVERLNQIIQDLRNGQAAPDLAKLTFLAA